MSVGAWIKASRLPSQSYIALPLLLGQVLAWRATGEWSWTIFALVQAFGLFDQFYIVYANDYADHETDQLNKTSTIFSGGSRVLVEESLSRTALGRAAVLMAALSIMVGLALTIGWDRTFAAPLAVIGVALLWAYSFGPIRLSYRGGGEFLQMLGVGLVLPLLGYEAQAGELASFPWSVLAFLLPMNLATGLCTALPDEPSDRLSDKRTAPVLFGGFAVRVAIILLNATGIALFWSYSFHRIEALEWDAISLVVVSLVALGAQLSALRRAEPGSHSILAFVFFGLLCNLALTASLLLDLAVP